jgi:hypothetical protein
MPKLLRFQSLVGVARRGKGPGDGGGNLEPGAQNWRKQRYYPVIFLNLISVRKNRKSLIDACSFLDYHHR